MIFNSIPFSSTKNLRSILLNPQQVQHNYIIFVFLIFSKETGMENIIKTHKQHIEKLNKQAEQALKDSEKRYKDLVEKQASLF